MCGLVGYIGKDNFDLQKIKFLLYWNAMERGRDSTGVFTPLSGVVKDAEEASVFINDKKNIIVPDKLLIGHTRYKTVGSVTKKNAHPFEHSNLIGVHNGGISNIWELVRKKDLKTADYDVDSDALFAILNKDSNPSVLGEIEGAAAILFIDKSKTDNILYCFRNKERPLFRGKIGNSMYISSIKESLEAIDCIEIKEFKENYLYTIIDGEIKHTLKIKPFEKPKVETKQSNSNTTRHTSLDKAFDVNKLIGKWAQADHVFTTNVGQGGNLSKDKFYFITDKDGEEGYRVKVLDDNNKLVVVPKYVFKFHSVDYQKDDWVIALNDIKRASDNEVILQEGDLMMVNSVEKDGILTDINKSPFKIPFRMFRKMKDNELTEGIEKPFKDACCVNLNEFVEEEVENEKDIPKDTELFNIQDLSISLEDIFRQLSDIRGYVSMNIECNKDFDRLETMIMELSEKVDMSVIIG